LFKIFEYLYRKINKMFPLWTSQWMDCYEKNDIFKRLLRFQGEAVTDAVEYIRYQLGVVRFRDDGESADLHIQFSSSRLSRPSPLSDIRHGRVRVRHRGQRDERRNRLRQIQVTVLHTYTRVFRATTTSNLKRSRDFLSVYPSCHFDFPSPFQTITYNTAHNVKRRALLYLLPVFLSVYHRFVVTSAMLVMHLVHYCRE